MRQLAGPRRLADPQLVEDLAGLGVPPVVDLGRLERGEDVERLDRELRPERERLERGDDRVPPEQRREPRHAGRDVALALLRAVVHEQPEIGDAPADRQVEQLVIGRDRGRAAGPGVVRGRALVGGDPRRLREELAVLRRGNGRRGGSSGRRGSRSRRVRRPDDPRQLVLGARREVPRPPIPDARRPASGRRRAVTGSRAPASENARCVAALTAVEPVVAERRRASRRRGDRQQRPSLPAGSRGPRRCRPRRRPAR